MTEEDIVTKIAWDALYNHFAIKPSDDYAVREETFALPKDPTVDQLLNFARAAIRLTAEAITARIDDERDGSTDGDQELASVAQAIRTTFLGDGK